MYAEKISGKRIIADKINMGASYYEVLMSITEAKNPSSCMCVARDSIVDISKCEVHHVSGGCPKNISPHFRNFELGRTINKFLSTMGGSVVTTEGPVGHIISYDPEGKKGLKRVT